MEVENDPKKRGAGKTALIADDSQLIRKMLAKAFLSDGFKTCIEAGDGREAVAAGQCVKPDIIILDLSMPVMNGLEVASRLRKIHPHTPIILFTLHGDSLARTDLAKSGVTQVVSKSASLLSLLAEAHALMTL